MLTDRSQKKRRETTDHASKFCDPYVSAKSVVEVGNIGNERLGVSAIPVQSNDINLEKKKQVVAMAEDHDMIRTLQPWQAPMKSCNHFLP